MRRNPRRLGALLTGPRPLFAHAPAPEVGSRAGRVLPPHATVGSRPPGPRYRWRRTPH